MLVQTNFYKYVIFWALSFRFFLSFLSLLLLSNLLRSAPLIPEHFESHKFCFQWLFKWIFIVLRTKLLLFKIKSTKKGWISKSHSNNNNKKKRKKKEKTCKHRQIPKLGFSRNFTPVMSVILFNGFDAFVFLNYITKFSTA